MNAWNDEMKQKTFTSKKKKSKYAFLKRFILKTITLIGAVLFSLHFLIAIVRVEGNTMSPFVRDGDLCIFYRLEDLYLNDVVLYEDATGDIHIGRIVAGNNQEVDFPENGGYQVNGYLPSEEVPYETYQAEESTITYPLKLGDDEYFILNDFRQLTNDSREIGAVKKSQIKGKLLLQMRRRNF